MRLYRRSKLDLRELCNFVIHIYIVLFFYINFRRITSVELFASRYRIRSVANAVDVSRSREDLELLGNDRRAFRNIGSAESRVDFPLQSPQSDSSESEKEGRK